ncbi:MAG: aromatic ring-hydroxylating oxygenase subunit alpha, partial [Panacagrimonas sp.]
MTRVPLDRLKSGLPATWYYDPQHYARELETIWNRQWVAVCREEEIPSPGDWRTVRVGTQSILVFKETENQTRAVHNVCRHRGSVLCPGEAGRFERKRIVCPYHSWTYDLSGQLVATPRRMETPDFRMEDFPLFNVSTHTWGGFIFVCLEGTPPFEPPHGLENYSLEKLRTGKRIVADVKANWKLLCENFSECFHCPPVHPELCRVVTAYKEAGAWGLRGNEMVLEYKAGAQTLTLDGSSRLPPFSSLDERQKKILYIPQMHLPNLFLNVHPDYVNSHLMFPTGPESVRIVYDWLFDPAQLPLSDAD